MKRTNFATHVAALIVVTILCGLIYATVQQSHRSVANDPQLQIASDLKSAIEHNHPVAQWMNGDSIDISQSLSVFKTLYKKNGAPLQSTGFLDGQLPQIPRGVLDFTNKYGEDVITWQPGQGVRIALVVEAVASPEIGYVVAGRSLREVEKRESDLTTMVLVAWLICSGVILLHFLLSYFSYKNQTK